MPPRCIALGVHEIVDSYRDADPTPQDNRTVTPAALRTIVHRHAGTQWPNP